jgi:hypothetical protein
MDKIDQEVSNDIGFSTNMKNSSLKKKDKMVAQILATKFHTKFVEEPRANKEV